jgi:hypothetical protein
MSVFDVILFEKDKEILGEMAHAVTSILLNHKSSKSAELFFNFMYMSPNFYGMSTKFYGMSTNLFGMSKNLFGMSKKFFGIKNKLNLNNKRVV